MLEKIRLEDCGPFSFNYNAHSLCVVLAEAYEHHQVAYIGGGDALDRLFLRNALLLEWQDKHVEFLSKEAEDYLNELLNAVINGSIDSLTEQYVEAPILVINDFHYLARKDASVDHFYSILKKRFDKGRLTVVFSQISYSRASKCFTEPLYAFLGAGMQAELHSPDSGELFFFENDYEKMLRQTFLTEGVIDVPEEEIAQIAKFLRKMSIYHIDAAVWYLFLAAMGGTRHFTTDEARDILKAYSSTDLMKTYAELLRKTLEDESVIAKCYRAMFIWATQDGVE